MNVFIGMLMIFVMVKFVIIVVIVFVCLWGCMSCEVIIVFILKKVLWYNVVIKWVFIKIL